MSHHHTRRRVVTVAAGLLLALPASAALSGTAYADSTKKADRASGSENGNSSDPHTTKTDPQPASNADYSGHGANQHGPYDSTRDGSASANGNGGGKSTGKPCAGCVGKADNKNPKGQQPGGSDHNAGYECDRNHGIGRGNPAHTGCTAPEESGGTGGTGGTGGEDCDVPMPAGSTDCTPGTGGSGGEDCDVPMPAGSTDCTPGTGGSGGEDCDATMPAGSDADCAPGTGVEGTGTETETGGTPGTSGPQVKGEKLTRIAPQVLGDRATRASVLPFTGTHVDELLVAGVLLLVSGSAGILLGRRREA
ncbi:MAG: hypothetical protein QOK42_821 [Frankiaceae bacterium]|jgi:hypothetical protein|nr:hypothetical protein [Frankiaceae bacterium]MDX6275320.1 hypothetical protein [Frankiales bacterium]